ncbi:MAG: hypothetical protein ACI9MN_000352, partial [Saprospiraceae bacterium]
CFTPWASRASITSSPPVLIHTVITIPFSVLQALGGF